MKKVVFLLFLTLAAKGEDLHVSGEKNELSFVGHNNFGMISYARTSGGWYFTAKAMNIEHNKVGVVGFGRAFGQKAEHYHWRAETWFGGSFAAGKAGNSGGISAEAQFSRIELASNVVTIGQQFTDHRNEQSSWQTLSFGEPFGEICSKFGWVCLGAESDWLRFRGESTWSAGPEAKSKLGRKGPTIAVATLRNTRGFWELKVFLSQKW